MIPHKLSIRGVTVFKEVELDFDSIAGDVVAITGLNGAGKSTLLESLFAALYRTFPVARVGSTNTATAKTPRCGSSSPWGTANITPW